MSTHPEQHAILGTTEGDRRLAALGVQRLAIPIPFANAGGPINVYLIENLDGSLTLFDAGLGTPEALDALDRGFAEAGRRMQDVRQILISHGHVDHYGAARRLVERSGAKVLVHARDTAKVLAGPEKVEKVAQLADYLRRLGVPEDEIEATRRFYSTTDRFGPRLPHVEPVEEGQRFGFRHFEAEVLHAPGHTPGLICLHVASERILFSDDHVLARVSPNPVLELGDHGEADKFRALEAYLASARRVHALDLDWVLPGHGPPFQDYRPTLESLFRFYERRQQRLLSLLDAGPQTVYELLPGIFGRYRPGETFLMLSEALGNLEVLESMGEVRCVTDPRPYRWERVPSPT